MADETNIFGAGVNPDELSELAELAEKSQAELGKLSKKVSKDIGDSLKKIGAEAKAQVLAVTSGATAAEKKYGAEQEALSDKRKSSEQAYIEFLKNNVNKVYALRKEELKSLEVSYELGIISTEEYFKRLENYRNRYFRKGSKEWIDFTAEVLEHNKKLAEEQEKALLGAAEATAKDIESVFSSLEKEREKLEGKLQNLPIKKNNKIVGEKTIEYVSLADIDRQNEFLEEYLRYMGEAQSKISAYWRTDTEDSALNEKNAALKSEYFSQMRNMPVEDALDFVRVLLGNTEEKFYGHLAAFEKRSLLAESISKALFSEEASDAADSAARNLGANFSEALADELSGIADKFFTSGENACESFGEGFMSMLDSVMSGLTSRIAQGMASLGYGDFVPNGDTNNIENHTNYNIYGSSAPTETIRLMREKEQMRKMMLD